MLYRTRFIFTADIFGAWSIFGGVSAQLNNMSPILHLATTDSIAAALLYDSILSAHMEELDRSRAERSDAVIDFNELLAVEQTRFKLRAIAQAAKEEPDVEKVGGNRTRMLRRELAPRPRSKHRANTPRRGRTTVRETM